MNFSQDDLKHFCSQVWQPEFSQNSGGMGPPDLFTLYLTLRKLKPKVVIESGVWNGISTKLIRRVLPEAIIICLDPRNIPHTGFKDTSINTYYYVGQHFVDFKNLDLKKYDPKDIFCFFDCHQNMYHRLMQCQEKKITNVFCNDNYPKGCGSHFTLTHLIEGDNRNFQVTDTERTTLLQNIELYYIFPNVYPGNIKTSEGTFQCLSYFTTSDNTPKEFSIFKETRNTYRWNTFIKLKALGTSI